MAETSRWNTFWMAIILIVTAEIIIVTFYSLMNGVQEIFPYLFILPIILLARIHPRFGIYFTILLGWIYLTLVLYFLPRDINTLAASIPWFYIFVTLGVVISSLAESNQQEQKFREMFDNSLAGIFSVDLASRKITRLNQRTAAILGYLPAELEGIAFSRVWWDEKETWELLRNFSSEKRSDPAEAAFRTKEGTKIWVLLTASPGGESAMVCSIIDVTDKREIRDNLIESELRYHMLFDSATDTILIHDHDGRILKANQIASRQSGYSVRQLEETTLQSLGILPSCGLTPEQFTRLQSHGYYHFESRLRRRDGSSIPVEISCKIIEYAGKPALLSTLRDITERLRAEAALRESEMRYRMIGDLIPFGVWACDASGNFTYLSASFLSLLNTTLDDVRKKGWMHLLPREDYDRTIADWRQCVQMGSFWDYEYRITGANGKVAIVLSRGAPHFDEAGKITSWVGIHIDITERKRYEERLEASLSEKEVIIKEVHHRVKNNMQVISGFLQLQSNYLEDPVAIDKLNESQQRVRTMALVHEKLYQSRSLGVINAAEYIKSLVADLLNSFSMATRVDVKVDVDDVDINLDMAIPCGLIINELVTNSLKHAFAGREEGRLMITMHHREDHTFELIVRDDGAGLPDDFETRSRASLGMQLVNVLVRQLGGELKTENDQGARFLIVFPEKF